MSRVRIVNPAQEKPEEGGAFYPNAALHSYGTVIKLDGRELPMVRGISLHAHVDSIVRVDVELLVSDLDIEIGADVHINAVVLEPGIVEIERSNDGKTQRIRFIREAP